MFNNTEEWWQAIPAEIRPRKDQPFYHLFAENEETEYVAYVSEQNLLPTRPASRCATRRSRKCSSAMRAAATVRATASTTEPPQTKRRGV